MNTELVDATIDEDLDEGIDERAQSTIDDEKQLSILFGTYADIMFILLPFFVVAILKLWQSDVK